MLVLVSEKMGTGSAGLGWFYAARGLGTAIGPIVGRRFFKDESKWMRLIGFCCFVAGLSYGIVGYSQILPLMLLFLVVAHASSGINWVMTTVLLQKRTPDEFRGRVFSAEWLSFTLAQSISVFVASSLLDSNTLPLGETFLAFAAGFILFGLLWLAIFIPGENRYYKKLKQAAA